MAEYLKSEADALKALEDSLAEIPGEYEAVHYSSPPYNSCHFECQYM